jgi:small subunit ribosomal protein S2
MVDTNSNPKLVDFPIPSNDDATKSITIVLDAICGAIKEGLDDRKVSKETTEEAKATKDATPAVEETPIVEAAAVVVEETAPVVEEVAPIEEAATPNEEAATEEK